MSIFKHGREVGMAIQAKAARQWSVHLTVEGEVRRVISAVSEEDAIRKAKKMLLAEDGQTPKSGSLMAFCWETVRGHARRDWRDMSDEEREEDHAQLEQEKAKLEAGARAAEEAQ